MTGKEKTSICMVCDSAIIDGRLVPAGEYSLAEDAVPSHGVLSQGCADLLYRFDVNSDHRKCPSPGEEMGNIIYVPWDRRLKLPDNFFKTVAPGYDVTVLSKDYSRRRLDEVLRSGVSLIISRNPIGPFGEVDCPVVSGHVDIIELVGGVRKGLEKSRQEHYRKHFT